MSRKLLGLLACALGLSILPAVAQYPDKPIKMIVPYAAGGGADSTARIVAQQMGQALGQHVDGRGIAVLDPQVSEAELKRLDAAGVRGLRFSVWNPADTVATIEMIEPLARRIADLGWHAQLHMTGDQIVAQAALLKRLPCRIVFDHMGRLPPEQGPDHPAFAIIGELLGSGRAWVKLSGAYLNTWLGPPAYPDATRIARAFVGLAPERLVWGSDWPHVTEPAEHKPDDARLLDLLAAWSGSDAVRQRILVSNPAELYGFA